MAKNTLYLRKSRARFAITTFTIIMIVLIARLSYIMIVKSEEYTSMARQQQYMSELVMPSRGTIYDSLGKELAVSLPIYDMWIEITYLGEGENRLKREEDIYNKLTSAIEIDKEKLKKDLSSDQPRLILKGQMSHDEVKKVRELGISQIWFDEKNTRLYPYGRFAPHVLGHVSGENIGLAGIENYLDISIKGIPGRRIYLKDAHGRQISMEDERYNKPVPGENLILNLDETIQHILDEAMIEGYQRLGAKKITGIVMDTKTGGILAMSTIPDYDPNKPFTPAFETFEKQLEEAENEEDKTKIYYDMWRNPAVNDAYEPGSPFKVITAAAALEENLTFPGEMFNDKGYLEIAGEKIYNFKEKSYGAISLEFGFKYSLNTVFMTLAQRLGEERLSEYIDAFGFGKTTGIDLPGEASGIVLPINKVGPVELANISFGQGISVTPIQMITAINVIGNEGKLMKPEVVRQVVDKEGNVTRQIRPEQVKQVVSKETAHEVLLLMEKVVNEGSGVTGAVEGYRVAGKTGTANKVAENGIGYSKTKVVNSFVSIAPVEDPRITILIVVDEPPVGMTGSDTAAPIAAKVMKGCLKYLGIKQNSEIKQEKTVTIPDLKEKSYEDASKALKDLGLNAILEKDYKAKEGDVVISTFPVAGEKVSEKSSIMLYFKSKDTNGVKLPDLSGKTAEEAERILSDLNLTANFSGSGKVVSQNPLAGKVVEEKSVVSVKLE